ncbi:MAG: ZIP family metal transporter [Thermoprotei archaeon]
MIEYLDSLSLPLRILVLSLIPALLTSLGAVPVILGKRIGEKGLDIGLGFSAGVMLVATFTSLLLPALETGMFYVVYAGFIAGVIVIHLLNEFLPHTHFIKGYEGPREGFKRFKRMVLTVFAIIIHNIPEGMAVGVTIIENTLLGFTTALAIGIQDVPEGFAVALPYYTVSRSRSKSLGIGVFSGFTELLAAYIPWILITILPELTYILLPFLMAFSAGAMTYVVVHELIPEIYGHGHDNPATLGFFLGFIVMLSLDILLT